MKTKIISNGITYFSEGYVNSKIIIAKEKIATEIFKELEDKSNVEIHWKQDHNEQIREFIEIDYKEIKARHVNG